MASNTKMMGGSASGGVQMGNMHAGMSRKNPAGVDKSMTLGKTSVDSDATRGGVAPTPKSLGPRDA